MAKQGTFSVLKTVIIDGVERQVRVQKVPMSTGKKKFTSGSTSADNSKSVFERFHGSNGSRHKTL